MAVGLKKRLSGSGRKTSPPESLEPNSHDHEAEDRAVAHASCPDFLTGKGPSGNPKAPCRW